MAATAVDKAVMARGNVTLRPGVPWPMWPLVTDATALEALEASQAASRWLEKWAGLEPREDWLWQAILRGFARTGRPQDGASLAPATGVALNDLAELLDRLRRRDMIVLDEAGGGVTAAYPFCAWPTEHRVAIAGGETVGSLCAIDALGAGGMLGADAVVQSACRACGVPVRIETRDQGRTLAVIEPSTTLIWAGVGYAGNCSATSSCTRKAFFCSDAHLAEWRKSGDREGSGFGLAPEAALQYALAVFVPLLAAARPED